ncbi:MAG: substrate-binding periplasmic protein [Pseudobdellovibrionaceae bacterium]
MKAVTEMPVYRRKSLLVWLLVPIFIASISSAQGAPSSTENKRPEALRFSASVSWSEPYAFFDPNKKLAAGILKEVMDAIAEEMGKSPVYVTLPRKLVDAEAEKNKFDARCYVIESWVKDPKLYNWSAVLFDIVNIVASPISVTPVRKIEDLKGHKVGTVLGYKYPKLESLFADSTIGRSDSGTETSNIEKLIQNRVSYAIVEAAQFSWHLKSKARDKFDMKRFFEVERYPVKCALLKSSSVSVNDFKRAIEKLKRQGYFKTVLAKYTPR